MSSCIAGPARRQGSSFGRTPRPSPSTTRGLPGRWPAGPKNPSSASCATCATGQPPWWWPTLGVATARWHAASGTRCTALTWWPWTRASPSATWPRSLWNPNRWTWPSSAWRSWGRTYKRSWQRPAGCCGWGGPSWWPRWPAASRTCGPSWAPWPGSASPSAPRTSPEATSTPSSSPNPLRFRRRRSHFRAWRSAPVSTSGDDAGWAGRGSQPIKACVAGAAAARLCLPSRGLSGAVVPGGGAQARSGPPWAAVAVAAAAGRCRGRRAGRGAPGGRGWTSTGRGRRSWSGRWSASGAGGRGASSARGRSCGASAAWRSFSASRASPPAPWSSTAGGSPAGPRPPPTGPPPGPGRARTGRRTAAAAGRGPRAAGTATTSTRRRRRLFPGGAPMTPAAPSRRRRRRARARRATSTSTTRRTSAGSTTWSAPRGPPGVSSATAGPRASGAAASGLPSSRTWARQQGRGAPCTARAGGLLARPGSQEAPFALQMKRKSENGPEGRAQSPGKKVCRGSERGRMLGPCVASPTATFGDLRNAKAGQARCRHVPPVTPPPQLQDWLRTFQRWSSPEKLLALDELIDRCEPPQIKHMMQVIEPQFQRDFISLLPKELALYVLSFLEPRDLLHAAQTCRYWRILAEDNLLWREKCRDVGIEESLSMRKRRLLSPGFMYSPWKLAFLRQHCIDMNWRSGDARPPKVLKGHDDHVITCLQFCGNRIVSGSDDNTLKVWSAVTGECVQTLVGHTGGVWSSQMSDNIVISGSTDRTLKVWNADTGECVHTLYGHTSTVRCMHLHGTRVVSGSRDATLRLWDIETGQCLHVLMGHVAAVRCVQYDGHKVVSGAYDYTVKVWDPETESCIHTLQGHTNRVYSLQFDGTHIVSGSLDTSIRVWDAESGNCLHTLMGHQSLTSGMELRDNILVSGNADSTVKIWDIKTGQCLQTLQGPSKHQSAVTCLQFSSKFVVTSSDDGTVKLWDLKTGEFVRNLVALESGGSGGVVWRIRASNTKLVCAVGSRNGTEETKLLVLDFDVDLK